jgi:hypothetical protein
VPARLTIFETVALDGAFLPVTSSMTVRIKGRIIVQ